VDPLRSSHTQEEKAGTVVVHPVSVPNDYYASLKCHTNRNESLFIYRVGKIWVTSRSSVAEHGTRLIKLNAVSLEI